MQIFHRSSNAIARISLLGAALLVGFLGYAGYEVNRSPVGTGQRNTKAQPVPFSHEHHVEGLGLDCRYCHTSVETSSFAGIPPISTCMNCHSQIWTNAQILEPIRAAYRDNKPIAWARIHSLPDYVQFNHSIHIAKGVGCVSCHGRVDKMQLMYQDQPLTMEWCLECHRHPERHLRPRERVFDLAWQPADQIAEGTRLVKEYHVKSYTNCSTCHY